MHSNQEGYAILLGSGISKAAGIPTGWEVVLDLLAKLARLENLSLQHSELADWYRQETGRDPSYSSILEGMAKTPSERQKMLQSYWEATDEEREAGIKQPTTAHRAIADLVKRHFVKVIVTTNFDRLMEDALEQVGIHPIVLSTVSQVEGASPLPLLDCCVFKVHGDYQDSFILNTPVELDHYPDAINKLLDRIFDDYGLVVCGWSAEWDIALREAIERSQSRRFTTYWATRGEPSGAARQLIRHRRAEVITIADADSFFENLRDNVVTIQELESVHPLSVEVSVARMKKYLAEERHRIQLADLINRTVADVIAQTSGEMFDTNRRARVDPELLMHSVRAYTTSSSALMEIGALGGYWMEEYQLGLWETVLDRLLSRGTSLTGTVALINLQRLPGILLLYALGLGAVTAGRLHCLQTLFQSKVNLRDFRGNSVDDALGALFVNNQEIAWEQLKFESIGSGTAFNDIMHGILNPAGVRLGLDDQQYALAFDKLEVLMALYMLRFSNPVMAYPRPARCLNNQNWGIILAEVRDSLTVQAEGSPYAKCGILGNTVSACISLVDEYCQYVDKLWNPRARSYS